MRLDAIYYYLRENRRLRASATTQRILSLARARVGLAAQQMGRARHICHGDLEYAPHPCGTGPQNSASVDRRTGRAWMVAPGQRARLHLWQGPQGSLAHSRKDAHIKLRISSGRHQDNKHNKHNKHNKRNTHNKRAGMRNTIFDTHSSFVVETESKLDPAGWHYAISR